MNMSQLNYIYPFAGKSFNDQIKYPGERILYKNENIKFEDSNENKHYEANVFYTNFRVLCLTGNTAIDIPYNFISSHTTKTPIFTGRKYIQIDFKQGITLASCCPMYIRENFTPEQIQSSRYVFPKYAQIKFSDKNADMDKSYQFLQAGIKAKEYELSHQPKPSPQTQGGINPNYITPQPKVTGLGMDRVKNMVRGKLETQNRIIQGSFTDIHSLSPITKEVAGSEYYVKLGEQINQFFMDYFAKNPKTKALTLIDAYCLYNRARTGNTISPKDMKQAIKQLTDGKVMHDIIIKNFNNEMIVIQTPEFSGKNILALIKKFMQEKKQHHIDMKDLSNILHIENVLLEKTIIEDMLNNGLILIDESDLDVRYYLNIILPYQLK